MQLGGVAPVPLAEELLTHAPWIPMIEAVLGARQRLFFYGAVVAEPDAQTQQKHMDGWAPLRRTVEPRPVSWAGLLL
eukprot:1593880-Prymnesium_polylepis.1